MTYNTVLNSKIDKAEEGEEGEYLRLNKINDALEVKYTSLVEWFKLKNSKVLVALSGGVDSAVVALVAKNALGKQNVMAITANYQTLSGEELSTAVEVAKELGISHRIIKY